MYNSKSKEIGAKRVFLNELFEVSLNSSMAYCVKVHSYHEELRNQDLFDDSDIQFVITDCGKQINLDFDIDSKEKMRNSLFKLDTIISTCEEMKKDIKVARKIVREGQKKRKEMEDLEKNKDKKNKDSLISRTRILG